jgi:hypothetical protein
MEAKELRIGNYVMDRGSKTLCIDWMDENKVNMKMMLGVMEVHPVTEEFGYCKPIILTEEWLEKFGFHYHKSKPCIYYIKSWGVNGVAIVLKDYHYVGFEYEMGKGYTKQIDYVHQLQNIYYALTGTDLTVTA